MSPAPTSSWAAENPGQDRRSTQHRRRTTRSPALQRPAPAGGLIRSNGVPDPTAGRRPAAQPRPRPRGRLRATTIAALVNAGWLLALNTAIAAAAWHLAVGTRRVEGLPVLTVSAVAALVMLGGALILGGDADDDGAEDLNVKAVLLDTAADAAAAAGVAASGAVILGAGGWYWLDPLQPWSSR